MKTVINYPINSRLLTTFNNLESEQALNQENNYLFDLSYLSVLEVIGDKSIEFMQGQLSCDMRLLSDIQMVQGAVCNLKGRILALADIVDWQGVKMVLPSDLLEATQSTLNKTALLSRVNLQPNDKLSVFGFLLQNEQDLIPDSIFLPKTPLAQANNEHYCYYHLGQGFYVFLVKQEYVELFTREFKLKHQLLGSLTWHTLRLKQHQIEIYPESRGMFLPHRIDLHKTSYLSFDKGCYKGQEIIARTHYRATLKHELKVFIVNTDSKIYSGQKLIKPLEGTEYGELIDYSILGENSYLIAASVLKEPVDTILLEGGSETTLLR